MDTFEQGVSRKVKARDEFFRQEVEFESACPDCGSEWFNPGPRGGLAHNIRCVGCGSKFWFSPPFRPRRIDSEDRFFCLDVKLKIATIISGDGLRAIVQMLGKVIQ